MVSKATPALLNHSGPNLALPCLSYLTPSLVPSRTAYGPTRHNMPTFGTVISPLMHTWLRGSAPPGGGNSRSSHPTSLKLYVASFSLSQRISFTTSESGLALADSTQFCSNRLTEILTVSTNSAPRGFRSDIVYRHWQLSHPVLSPTLRTVTTKTSSPQLYHGPTDLDSWFPEVFGPYSMSSLRASRVILVTSTGSSHHSDFPPPLPCMDNLRDAVEIYRVLPYLPPGHLGRVFSSAPPLYLAGFSSNTFQVGKRTVYVQLHCHSGFSPLHSVLRVGVFRISLCVLRTHDHVTWVPTLY